MCAIIGALLHSQSDEAGDYLNQLWLLSHERGRDGRGFSNLYPNGKRVTEKDVTKGMNGKLIENLPADIHCFNNFIGNLRAEPTTEYVNEKKLADQQPYECGHWAMVHNGTIANDAFLADPPREVGELTVNTKIDSGRIAETLNMADAYDIAPEPAARFLWAIRRLQGSFAILANHDSLPDEMYAAANYRPVWYVINRFGVFFASARHYFPEGNGVPQMLPPYTAGFFRVAHGKVWVSTEDLRKPTPKSPCKALVVCSGGLDSVVAAKWAQNQGYEITLLHFHYGSRAQQPEHSAIRMVQSELKCELIQQDISLYRKEDSPLLDADSKIAGGEAGAEFAYEWVPARNLLMLSMATALAEARGIETLVLGNNLEEAGAYPDNEPEFIAKFNDLLPFAIGDGKRLKVIMPVGNLMKHEIVALGHALGAPLHLTWSCYRAGQKHCGTCGPCFMRRTAFKINNLPEVIEYEV